MKLLYKKIWFMLISLLLVITTLSNFGVLHVYAAGTTAHIRIVGKTQTVWYGDITPGGCSITDTNGKPHVYATALAVCALDAASKSGGFSYAVKDFGGSLGLFLQTVGTDTGASDFSTYWSYDLNGVSASQGISSQGVATGDTLYFHFEDPSANPNTRAVNDGITYLKSQQDNTGAITGFSGISSWAAMTFAANGVNPSTLTHAGPSLLSYIGANKPTTSSPATAWERDILAITAAGVNPYSFNGTNYVTSLETYHTNGQIGVATQINDDFFGLLALLSEGAGASMTTKQDVLNFILAHQNADGGYSWSTTGTSDVDDTAAALLALSEGKKSGLTAPTLDSVIASTKAYVLAAKNADGGFASMKGDTSNTSTTSWVVMALNSLGANSTEVTAADAYMRTNQEENGAFHWQAGSTGETFTSSYAVLALAGKYWPVKIYAGTAPSVTPSPSPTAVPTSTPTPTTTSTPTPTVKPTMTPVPTGTVTPTPKPSVTPSPTVIPQPNQNDRFTRLIQLQEERFRKIQEEQRKRFIELQIRLEKLFADLAKRFQFGK